MPRLGGNTSHGTLSGTEQVPLLDDTYTTTQDIANRAGNPGLSIEFTSDANLTLTDAQATAVALTFTDSPTTLTAGRDVIFPSHFPVKYVKNSTAQTLTLKKSAQPGVTLAAGAVAIVASSASDVVLSLGDTASSVVWGTITGTLSAQSDLAAELALKQARAPNVQTVSSAATVTPTFSNDLVDITALATGLTLANPTGTAIDGLGIVIRIKDNGTARSIGYGSQYRAIGVTLPTTTVLSKTLYLGMVYNSTASKWDVVSAAQEA